MDADINEKELEEWISKAEILERHLDIQHRRYHLKTYKNCFVGSAAVYVIISLKYANNTQQAVEFGNKLLKLNLIKHVTNKAIFKNEDLFYTFVPGYSRRKRNLSDTFGLYAAVQRMSIQDDNTAQTQSNDENTDIKSDHKADTNDSDVDDLKTPKHFSRPSLDITKQPPSRRLSKVNGHERDALKLFDLIVSGSLFNFKWNSHLTHKVTQQTLIQYLDSYTTDEHAQDMEDPNLSYFQNIFREKIHKLKEKKCDIFINIDQISSLNADLFSYFFDKNNPNFEGKLFLKDSAMATAQMGCTLKHQFIELPETIHVNDTQIGLLKDEKYFGEILFKKFKVTNHKQEVFEFFVKVQRKGFDEDTKGWKFHLFLFLKSKPGDYDKVEIIWDFVCEEIAFDYISKKATLKRKECDEIEGFDASLLSKVNDQLTFIVNIRIPS